MTKAATLMDQIQPQRPPGAKTCSSCKGTGYIRRDATGQGVVCPECRGLGWKPL
jgi:DnaJ-class molecular chaperone